MNGKQTQQKPICKTCRHESWHENRIKPCSDCGVPIQVKGPDHTPTCIVCRRKNPHGKRNYFRKCDCEACLSAKAERSIRDFEWYLDNRDRKRGETAEHRRKAREVTLPTSSRAGSRWSEYEDAFVMRDDMTMTRIAVALGRTCNSVIMRRKRLRDPGFDGRRV